MAKMKGMCRNEDCEMCDQIQEAEKSNFKCEKCGKDLIPFGNKTSDPNRGVNKKLIATIVGIVAILAIAGGILFLGNGNSDDSESQDAVTDTIQATDSIEVAPPLPKDTVIITDTVVQRDTVTVEVLAKPKESKPKPVASSGTKNLGYATFKGSWPNDVNGRMVFTTSHVIDSKDPKKRVADAGDYIIGEWSDGHLVQGIWYGADNQVKGSIIIGK